MTGHFMRKEKEFGMTRSFSNQCDTKDLSPAKIRTRRLPAFVYSFTASSTCSVNPVSNNVTDCYRETNERRQSAVEVMMRW
jgi:hypothetical protein